MKKLLIDLGDKKPVEGAIKFINEQAKKFVFDPYVASLTFGNGIKVSVVDMGDPRRKVRKVNRNR